MNIFFSVGAMPQVGKKAWRLQDGDTWRRCTFGENLKEHDAKITDKEDVRNWINIRLAEDKETGLKVKGKVRLFDFFISGILSHVTVHRLSSAPIPDKAQMIQAIAQAKVGTPWLLYTDLAGNFRMLNSETTPIIANPDIAVRGEIASSEAYIGEQATQDSKKMDELYLQFIAGWLTHLDTRRLSVFIPETKDIHSLEDCLEKIQAWKHE
ncbi:MAG: hypothetical protein Q9N02_06225 [Ghiorsea sp.]|nr:hypothetical protein [Ghiorsea sp.]